MVTTERWAKNRGAYSHKIEGADRPINYKRLAPEEAEFVDRLIDEGQLTDWEISRQVFRTFGRDYSNSAVLNRRKNRKKKENE